VSFPTPLRAAPTRSPVTATDGRAGLAMNSPWRCLTSPAARHVGLRTYSIISASFTVCRDHRRGPDQSILSHALARSPRASQRIVVADLVAPRAEEACFPRSAALSNADPLVMLMHEIAMEWPLSSSELPESSWTWTWTHPIYSFCPGPSLRRFVCV